MKPHRVVGYLKERGISDPMKLGPEDRINRFLNKLHGERDNEAEGPYRSELIGASTLIAHFMPRRIKNPEVMFDNLINAFRRRGPCVAYYEPVSLAFAKILNDSSSQIRNRLLDKAFGSTQVVRTMALRYVTEHQRLAMRHESNILGMLDEGNPDVRGAAVRALFRHPKLATKHKGRILELL